MTVAIDGCSNGVQSVLITERLGQEIYSAMLHCSHRHRNITMTDAQNDRQRIAEICQLLLEIEPAHPRQAHIEHDASK